MTIRFYKLGDEGVEYTEVAVVQDGEIVDGEDELPPLHPEELNDEQRLLEHYDGPYLVAGRDEDEIERGYWITEPRRGIVGKYDGDQYVYRGSDGAVRTFLEMGDPSGLEATQASLVPRTGRESNLLKQGEDAWIPYVGPQGGEGWQQVGSGEVRYQQDPPGDVAEGYDENHWRQRWPELDGTEWNEELPAAHEMKEGDTILFVNRNGESEVGEVVGYGFVRREEWDHAKIGVELRDGRQVTRDEIAAYAPTASAVQPPELHEDPGWDDAPGMWTEYNHGNLVHFRDEDGEPQVGIVEGSSSRKGAVKVQTADRFHVVKPDQIVHRADPDEDYNRGYAILDTPFENVPDVEFSLEAPDPEFASKLGATVEDVRDAFGTVFGAHLMDDLEAELDGSAYDDDDAWNDAPSYDRDDPEDWIRAIRNYRGTDESGAYPDFKWELRGRANGMGMNRVERIIDEAFALDVSDPHYDVRDKLEGEEKNDPEEWLKAAAEWAVEDDWVSIGGLQEAVDDWSGTVPFGASNLHDHEGEPEEIIPLSETGENAGISAGAMFIAEWPDGGRAYITRIRDEQQHGRFHSQHMESSTEAERAMTGYHVQSALNEENETVHFPDHEYRHDTYLSVDSAPEDAILADHYLEEKPLQGVELPDGKPDNEIVEELGADVDDVKAAISETLQPGWIDDIEEQIDNDPNMDTENPADWVAGAKNEYAPNKAHVWNGFTEALASESYESPVNRDDFMDMAAAAIIAGNKDMHSKNVMADDDGHIYPIDLDFSGYDMTDSTDLSQGVGKLVSTANSLGIEVSDEFAGEGDPNAFDKSKRPLGQEILAYIEEFAEQRTADEVQTANPMYAAAQMGDNVQRNFEAAKRGELRL